MNTPLDLARTQLKLLIPPCETTVRNLATQPAWSERFGEYARTHGLAEGADSNLTIAKRAALLGLLAGVRLALAGDQDTPELTDLLASLGPGMRSQYAAPLLSDILGHVNHTAAWDPGTLAARMRAEPFAETIGDLYQETIPQAERRQLGQFWTPRPLADLLAAWSVRNPADEVLDPASGAGVLLLSAWEQLTALGQDKEHGSAQLHANDIDPLVRALMLTNLAATHPASACEDLLLQDALTGRQPDHGRFDAIVSNPPFTRHHHLPEAYKQQIQAQLRERLGIRVSGFTSLFALFYLHCLSLLADNGRMAFITPSELLDAGYAKPIQRHLLDHVNLRAVLIFADEFAAFPGVDTHAIITLTDAGENDGQPVRFIELDSWPGVSELLAAADGHIQDGETTWGRVSTRTREQLASMRKWTVPARHQVSAHESTVPLGQIAKVMRGIATGNNDYFTLSDVEIAEHQIEERYLQPMLAKTRDCLTLNLNDATHARLRDRGRKAWLFNCQDKAPQPGGAGAAGYVSHGQRLGVPAGKLVSLRGVWWQVEKRTPPAILYTYLSRGWPRFIRNELQVLNLNGFHSVYPHEQITGDPMLLQALLAILNSTVTLSQLRGIGRSYGGGTIKVEPSELASLPVLDPRTLPAGLCERLAALYEHGKDLEPAPFQAVREQIDKLLSEHLR